MITISGRLKQEKIIEFCKSDPESEVNFLINSPLIELIAQADKIRRERAGSELDLCSIYNAKSGLCGEDCKFCAQSSRYATGIQIYPLKSKDEIIKSAESSKGIGAKRFGIVTSGNRLTKREVDNIAEAINGIKESVDIKICASLGVLDKEALKTLKDAGLSRYHHNIETSPHFYPKIVFTHKFQERIKTIESAKESGLEVCAGGIIGMGESWQDRIDMACLLRDLNVDSIPVNILVPIKGTPLESLKPMSGSDAIRTIAIFRIILKDKTIKIAAGRETVLKDFQAMGFLAGANGMIIGGYLTLKGRELEDDYKLIEEIEKLWGKQEFF